MNNKTVYVHYGHKKFDKTLFKPIKNCNHYIKPRGGFWASRKNAKYGWKDWNASSGFAGCDENNKISFMLSNNAKVLEIHSIKDVEKMMEKYYIKDELSDLFNLSFFKTIDFEKMKEDYDAMEIFISDDERLYDELYRWDCDSILILNPDVVEQIDIERNVADNVLENEMNDISFESLNEHNLEK